MPKKPPFTVIDGDKKENHDPGYTEDRPSAAAKKDPIPEQHLDDFKIPYPYEVWRDGVWKRKKDEEIEDRTFVPSHLVECPKDRYSHLEPVCDQPVHVTQFATAIPDQREYVEVTYNNSTRDCKKTRWVTAEQIASRQKILGLAGEGFPVVEGSSTSVIDYLAKFNKANRHRIPASYMVSRVGPYELVLNDNTRWWGWLLGSQWISPCPARVVLDESDRGNTSTTFTQSGSETLWFDKWSEISAKDPFIRWLLYSTFTSALLKYFNVRSFIIHHWGSSGAGKSALGRLASSAWGPVEAVQKTFNASSIALTETFKYMTDVPLVVDELQSAKNKTQDELIYSFATEQSKQRARREGGLQKSSYSYKSIMKTTGEEPLIGRGGQIDYGGQQNRALQIHAEPFTDPTDARAINRWLQDGHYGWGSLRFVERLVEFLNTSSGPERLKQIFTSMRDDLYEKTPTSVGAQVDQIAAVAATQAIAKSWLYSIDLAETFKEALQDAIEVARLVAGGDKRETPVTAILDDLRGSFASNRGAWFDLTDASSCDYPNDNDILSRNKQNRLVGILKGNEIWVIVPQFRKFCESRGLNHLQVLPALAKEEILYTPNYVKEKNYTTRRTHGQFSQWVYVLDRKRTGVWTSQDG